MLMLAVLTTSSMNVAVMAEEVGRPRNQFSKDTVTVKRTKTPSRTKVYDHRTKDPKPASKVYDHRTKTKKRAPKVVDHRIQPPKRAPKVVDHRTQVPKRASKAAAEISLSEATKEMARYKQWMIGANKTGLIGGRSDYNLKGKVNRKFLQYEYQGIGQGIDLGWTNNAKASTAIKRAKWRFVNQSLTNEPIRYGEPIAILWTGDGRPAYIKYSRRTTGINLDFTKKVSFGWAILGGKPGEPVRRGHDWVVIYNLKHKRPLIYFNRTVGAHIGWPDSSTWGTTVVTNPQTSPTYERYCEGLANAWRAWRPLITRGQRQDIGQVNLPSSPSHKFCARFWQFKFLELPCFGWGQDNHVVQRSDC